MTGERRRSAILATLTRERELRCHRAAVDIMTALRLAVLDDAVG